MPAVYRYMSHVSAAVFFSVGLVFSLPAVAAPKSEPWPLWEKHDPGASKSIDHSTWDRLLGTYLTTPNRGPALFAYGQVKAGDAQALDSYIRDLEIVEILTYSRPEQLAYWLNFYNALTVKVMLDHWPVKTILDVDLGGGGLFSNGPWDRELVSVEGTDLSLNDIEHRILRPIWQDPRIHYGVNCASIGCPNLAQNAFTAENVESLLTDAAKTFINSPRGVRVDTDGDLVVSKIYDWFQEDFGRNEEEVISHLITYAGQNLRAQLAGKTDIDDFDYDWDVNAADTVRSQQTAQPSN